jgi:hypothetical protein
MGSSVFPAPASGPTLAEINNSVATYAPSPNNWTLISTYTLNATANTFTFSGLTGYKTYKVVAAPARFSGTGGTIGVRLNSDTNYNYQVAAINGSQNYTLEILDYWILNNPGSSVFMLNFEIANANNSGNKTISGFYGDQSTSGSNKLFQGTYSSTSPLSSITIFNANAGNFTFANSTANLVHLYGAN